jgi:hypothetical protein
MNLLSDQSCCLCEVALRGHVLNIFAVKLKNALVLQKICG